LGIARLQNGLAPLQNAFTALQNGLAPLQNAFAALLHVLAVVRGAIARLFRRLDGLLGFLVVSTDTSFATSCSSTSSTLLKIAYHFLTP
jgi:hypothetical protein